MSKDYYITLGVSKGVDLNKIKKAYREVVKKYHPDVTRSRVSVGRFLEIREAYETLSDEAKRKLYDQHLEKQGSDIRVTKVSEIIETRRFILDEMESFFSSADEFFEGFLPGFFDREKGRIRGKDLYFEAILSPDEARRGGLFPISVPINEPCPRCRGTENVEGFFCSACLGYGRVRSEREFSVSMPPNVKHGTEMSLSMEDIGLKGVCLHLRILVDHYI